MPYYAEEIRFDGKPKPVIYAEKPPTRTAHGSKRRFHVEPKEMHSEDVGFTLSQAARMYGSGAEFGKG